MRYAFVSDIHGNLPAWNTVLADLAVHRVDRIVCLGDTVGYGPQPAECLRGVYAHVHQMVLGNHDAVVAGKMSAESFNDRAQRMIEWTGTQLGENARALFSSLPLVLKGPGFRCTHGDFTDPAVFNYVRTEEDARANFAAVPEQLLFCGHTHEAAVFLTGESGNVYKIEPQDFELEEGKRYLVNVGSVGSARDGDPRASYVIYDEERRGVYFHRVPFDFEAFRSAVAAAPGLDPDLVPFLRAAAARGTAASVREEADFAPAAAVRVEGGAREAYPTRCRTLPRSACSRAAGPTATCSPPSIRTRRIPSTARPTASCFPTRACSPSRSRSGFPSFPPPTRASPCASPRRRSSATSERASRRCAACASRRISRALSNCARRSSAMTVPKRRSSETRFPL